MQTEEGVKIVKRFFEAIYALKARGDIRGKQTFTAKYKINRWNFNTLEKEPERNIMQMAWLAILVNDFGVSSQWLLTGNGEMFVKKK